MARGSRSVLLAVVLLAGAALVGLALWLSLGGTTPARPPELVRDGSPTAEPVAPPAALERESATSGDAEREQPDFEPPPYGDLFALLAWLAREGRGPLPEVVANPADFGALLASQHRERWVQGAPYPKKLGEVWKPGTTAAFDPGVWKLENVLPADGVLPADITLAGSGTTRTLFVLDSLRPLGRVERMTLRDCSVLTENQPLIDARGELVGLTLERVRFLGFDSGLDPSPLVRARGLGLAMRDCELLGGYGRAPGSATLFDLPSAALLARFERCRFDALRFGLERLHPRITLACFDGTTSALIEDPATSLDSRAGVTFTNTPFVVIATGARPPALDVEALFPGWRALSK